MIAGIPVKIPQKTMLRIPRISEVVAFELFVPLPG
jgi:hypothetical protein